MRFIITLLLYGLATAAAFNPSSVIVTVYQTYVTAQFQCSSGTTCSGAVSQINMTLSCGLTLPFSLSSITVPTGSSIVKFTCNDYKPVLLNPNLICPNFFYYCVEFTSMSSSKVSYKELSTSTATDMTSVQTVITSFPPPIVKPSIDIPLVAGLSAGAGALLLIIVIVIAVVCVKYKRLLKAGAILKNNVVDKDTDKERWDGAQNDPRNDHIHQAVEIANTQAEARYNMSARKSLQSMKMPDLDFIMDMDENTEDFYDIEKLQNAELAYVRKVDADKQRRADREERTRQARTDMEQDHLDDPSQMFYNMGPRVALGDQHAPGPASAATAVNTTALDPNDDIVAPPSLTNSRYRRNNGQGDDAPSPTDGPGRTNVPAVSAPSQSLSMQDSVDMRPIPRNSSNVSQISYPSIPLLDMKALQDDKPNTP